VTFTLAHAAMVLALLTQNPPEPPRQFAAQAFEVPAPTQLVFWQGLHEPNHIVFRVASPELAVFRPSSLTIMCGSGHISISMKDGSVTFHNCDPDEAARQFWFKVEQAFPYFRSAILAGHKP
jgi:hypothetical protein